MFDDIFTDQVKTAIGVSSDATRLSEEDFAVKLEDRFASFVEGTKNTDELKYLVKYIAANWPEEYRLTTTVSAVPWLSVLSKIDPDQFASYVVEDLGGETIVGQGYSYKAADVTPIAASQGAQDFIADISTKLEKQLRENAAIAASEKGNLTPEEATAQAEAAPSSTLTDTLGLYNVDESTVESELALRPGTDISSVVAQGVEFETPLDLSALPGFDLLEVADQWTASDTLSYITDIDQTARMKLQDLLEGAGYFDQAREMGHVSARDGTNDVATQVAWQQFLADAVINGETNMQSWLTERTRTMRSRSMASVQEVYRDPASINTLIDSVSMGLLGRTLDVQERSSLLGKLMDWQREALLGPTYTQERYDVDLQARAKEFFDKQFMKERMQNRTDEFLYKIGAIGG